VNVYSCVYYCVCFCAVENRVNIYSGRYFVFILFSGEKSDCS
jgi:hypothetical protein